MLKIISQFNALYITFHEIHCIETIHFFLPISWRKVIRDLATHPTKYTNMLGKQIIHFLIDMQASMSAFSLLQYFLSTSLQLKKREKEIEKDETMNFSRSCMIYWL